jgi:hypothetical protein
MSRSQTWRNKKCIQLQKTLELCGKIVQSVIDEDEVEAVKKMMAPTKKRKREKNVESTTGEAIVVEKKRRGRKPAVAKVDDIPPPLIELPVASTPDELDEDSDSDDSVVLLTKNT